MSKYLKLFENHTQYEMFIGGGGNTPFVKPNVSYCVQENEVHYNPRTWADEYLTFVALEDGTFTFAPSGGNVISYSIDNGHTWSDLAADTNTPTVTRGNKVLWRGEMTPVDYRGVGTFSSTGKFKAQGNIMSLLFGADFKGQTDLTGKSYAFYRLFSSNSNLVNVQNLSLPATTLAESCYREMFKGCTSLTRVPELPATTLASNCYNGMFGGCTGLTTAPVLPVTTLANYCYDSMFSGCTSLVKAPTLPATTLTEGCYQGMFDGTNVLPDCSNIDFTSNSVVSSGGLIGLFAGTKVTDSDLDRLLPKNTNGKYYLPVTTLAHSCYSSMFNGCTSLTTAPELPATTLADSCYQQMFKGCTGLTTAPELPVTTLASSCYQSMFEGCTGLTTAPELPATILADSCYTGMFEGCTGLTTAPTLSATTLANHCYQGMFYGCTGLTTAPELPVTTLANYCYISMFGGCTSLTTAPELPATTLTRWCYASMFNGCTRLTKAPELPATTLTDSCYSGMFDGCRLLNYIKAMFTTEPSISYTDSWVSGVASTGTFVKNVAATWDVTGVNGIPEGWTPQTATE